LIHQVVGGSGQWHEGHRQDAGFFNAAAAAFADHHQILRGMLLTRATDNRLKAFFAGGEGRYGDAAFQGKGFRSAGQEAIYAAAIRLRRGPDFRGAGGAWRGDVVAPVIRDLGVALAMRPGEGAAPEYSGLAAWLSRGSSHAYNSITSGSTTIVSFENSPSTKQANDTK